MVKFSKYFFWSIIFFIAPMNYLVLNIGFEVAVYKILPYLVLISALLTRRKILIKDPMLNLLLIFYCLLTTFTNYSYYIYNNLLPEQGIVNSEYFLKSAFIQFFSFSLLLIQVNFYNSVFNKLRVDNYLKMIINGSLFSVIVGVFLLVINNEFRLTGLSTEPRHLGSILISIIAFIILNKKYNVIDIQYQNIKIVLVLTAIILTFSISSYLSLLSIFFIYIKKFFNIKSILLSVVLLILFLQFMMIEPVNDFFNQKLSGKDITLDTIMYFVPKDSLAITFLTNNWIYLIFGTGAGGITIHTMDSDFILNSASEFIINTIIIQEVLSNNIGGMLTPSSFNIYYISQYGLIGMFLFYIVLRRITKNNHFLKEYSSMFLISGFFNSHVGAFMFLTILSLVYVKVEKC